MELTPQEIQLFRHNGFIKFPTQLSTDHVEALKAAALKDMAEAVEPVARQDKMAESSEFPRSGNAAVSFERRSHVMKFSIHWNRYWVRI